MNFDENEGFFMNDAQFENRLMHLKRCFEKSNSNQKSQLELLNIKKTGENGRLVSIDNQEDHTFFDEDHQLLNSTNNKKENPNDFENNDDNMYKYSRCSIFDLTARNFPVLQQASQPASQQKQHYYNSENDPKPSYHRSSFSSFSHQNRSLDALESVGEMCTALCEQVESEDCDDSCGIDQNVISSHRRDGMKLVNPVIGNRREEQPGITSKSKQIVDEAGRKFLFMQNNDRDCSKSSSINAPSDRSDLISSLQEENLSSPFIHCDNNLFDDEHEAAEGDCRMDGEADDELFTFSVAIKQNNNSDHMSSNSDYNNHNNNNKKNRNNNNVLSQNPLLERLTRSRDAIQTNTRNQSVDFHQQHHDAHDQQQLAASIDDANCNQETAQAETRRIRLQQSSTPTGFSDSSHSPVAFFSETFFENGMCSDGVSSIVSSSAHTLLTKESLCLDTIDISRLQLNQNHNKNNNEKSNSSLSFTNDVEEKNFCCKTKNQKRDLKTKTTTSVVDGALVLLSARKEEESQNEDDMDVTSPLAVEEQSQHGKQSVCVHSLYKHDPDSILNSLSFISETRQFDVHIISDDNKTIITNNPHNNTVDGEKTPARQNRNIQSVDSDLSLIDNSNHNTHCGHLPDSFSLTEQLETLRLLTAAEEVRPFSPSPSVVSLLPLSASDDSQQQQHCIQQHKKTQEQQENHHQKQQEKEAAHKLPSFEFSSSSSFSDCVKYNSHSSSLSSQNLPVPLAPSVCCRGQRKGQDKHLCSSSNNNKDAFKSHLSSFEGNEEQKNERTASSENEALSNQEFSTKELCVLHSVCSDSSSLVPFDGQSPCDNNQTLLTINNCDLLSTSSASEDSPSSSSYDQFDCQTTNNNNNHVLPFLSAAPLHFRCSSTSPASSSSRSPLCSSQMSRGRSTPIAMKQNSINNINKNNNKASPSKSESCGLHVVNETKPNAFLSPSSNTSATQKSKNLLLVQKENQPIVRNIPNDSRSPTSTDRLINMTYQSDKGNTQDSSYIKDMFLHANTAFVSSPIPPSTSITSLLEFEPEFTANHDDFNNKNVKGMENSFHSVHFHPQHTPPSPKNQSGQGFFKSSNNRFLDESHFNEQESNIQNLIMKPMFVDFNHQYSSSSSHSPSSDSSSFQLKSSSPLKKRFQTSPTHGEKRNNQDSSKQNSECSSNTSVNLYDMMKMAIDANNTGISYEKDEILIADETGSSASHLLLSSDISSMDQTTSTQTQRKFVVNSTVNQSHNQPQQNFQDRLQKNFFKNFL
eukprot:GDKJ01004558.1.p1 GENE.GDKJ01004558.1~~GDKJ01004558.1.p1  ORF type:complete len:1432 (-),score=436.68 GDKJ01004558.1:3402-7175(-)